MSVMVHKVGRAKRDRYSDSGFVFILSETLWDELGRAAIEAMRPYIKEQALKELDDAAKHS